MKGKQMHKEDHRVAYVVKMKPIKTPLANKTEWLQIDPAPTTFCTYSHGIKCKYLEMVTSILSIL